MTSFQLKILLFTALLLIFISSTLAGYQLRSLGNVLDAIITTFGSLNASLTMLEFGNQEIHDLYKYPQGYPPFLRYGYDHGGNDSAKLFFKHLGIEHTSVDINGRHGAILFDVRNDIFDLFGGKTFDIVTNLGFTEHVGEGDIEENLLANQYQVFKNLHDAGTVNSLYFHDLPMIGSNFQHGVAHYNTSFFKQMAMIQNYDLFYLFVTDFGDDTTKTVVAGYVKTEDSPFMTYEEFCSLPGLQSIYFEYRILSVQLYFTNGDVPARQYNIHVDTEEVTSEQAASDFCDRELESLMQFGSFDRERCVSGVSEIIENKKIEKSIR